jgi:hypothetical protein
MDPLWVSLAAFGAPLVLGRIGLYRPGRRIRATLARLERTRLAEAVDGEVVKVVGEGVATGEPLVAPISGRPCLHYLAVIQRVGWGGWSELARESRGLEVELRDDSGTASILLEDALVDGDCTIWPRWGLSRYPPPHVRELLERNFQEPRPNLRIVEYTLPPGPIMVGGVLRRELDPGARATSYRDAPRRAVLRSTDAVALLVSRARFSTAVQR